MMILTSMTDLFHGKSANDDTAIDDFGDAPFDTWSIAFHFSFLLLESLLWFRRWEANDRR